MQPLYLHIVWNGPFQIIIIMVLLVRCPHEVQVAPLQALARGCSGHSPEIPACPCWLWL